MLNNMKLLALSSLFAVVSGCATQAIKSPQDIHNNTSTVTVAELKESKQPLKIATWSPTEYSGRYTAMVAGHLVRFENCLALTRDGVDSASKDNTLLLVLADNSFSWNADKEVLLFEGKPYKIGDELYLGGGAFTYPNGILTKNTKINWIECGLDKGWLGG